MLRRMIFVAALVLAAMSLFAQEGQQKERYMGVAIGTGGGIGGKTFNFDVYIDSFTPDGEVEELAALLKNKGQDELRRAMEKLNVGRFAPVGTTGNQIAVARKRKQGNNTLITIVTARNMSFGELYRSNRSVDYPFGVLQLKLNEKGEGVGQFIVAAKIRFDKKKGQYEVESYGNQYLKATNVRPAK